jgi:uncharacterized protein DUF4255
MIDQILLFLKRSLNTYLTSGKTPVDPQEDQVVFSEWKNTDTINFKLGAVSILLIKLDQENIVRAEDPFTRTLADGTLQKGQPEIRLNLYLLFVSHYQLYEDSLRNLSAVIQYFQSHRLLNHQNSPELNENVEQLVLELVSLSFSEQNEIWGALRLPYHPSVLYKAKMVVFRDQDFAAPSPVVAERIIKVSE